MSYWGRTALFLSFFVTSLCYAQERTWQRTFDLMWESRWQQTGLPVSALRWPDKDKRITYSINAAASRSNAQRVREAMQEVTQIIGWQAVELSADSTEAQVQFTLRTFSDDELRQFICWVSPAWDNWLFTTSKVQVAEQGAYYCLLHELMHVFGFPGHPQGDTVLSYFERNQRSLSDLDRFMLKAWYSGEIRPGASPMVASRVLNRLWIDQQVPSAQRDDARRFEQQWYDQLLKSLEGFAMGSGEPPTILYRSGLLSEEGKRTGRRILQGMLGHAYLHGQTVGRDLSKASTLLLANAKGGNTYAGTYLAQTLTKDNWEPKFSKPLCEWLRDAPLTDTALSEDNRKSVLEAPACALLNQP